MRIVLFDGDCHFCNWNVQFIIKHDPQATMHFASLQSDIGQELLQKHQIEQTIDSIVFLDNDRAYTASTAALQIAKHLTFPWRFAYLFIIIPRPMRDFFYQIIAKNRYKLNKNMTCAIPDAITRGRFLT